MGVTLSVPFHRPMAVEAEVAAPLAIGILPEVPNTYLKQIFARLSAEDKARLLQDKVVPVAWLPHLTLYAAVGETARARAESAGLRVVAMISDLAFRAALRGWLGPQILGVATFGLARLKPEFSASRRFTSAQIVWTIALMVWIVAGIFWLPQGVAYALASFLCGIFFLSVIAIRILCVTTNLRRRRPAPALLDTAQLPIYSVLVPVFRETRVLNQLLGALQSLHYPHEKLDIKLILEENDIAMQRALRVYELPAHFEIIIVPAGKPQTKPRALNYALQFARGQLVTIYDAEDLPEADQLQKAAAAFAAGPADLACLQAELAFYNPNENWLTRQFTVEYATLFKLILPSLANEGLPLPLGGTSNHFNTQILRKVGAWDSFNVTEDADLGLRLARQNYRTQMLDSITYEEANLWLGNWLQQRARWFKGFLQTWLVHMRHPVLLRREIGFDGFGTMQAMTIGVVFSALVHPIFLGFAIYNYFSGSMFKTAPSPGVSTIAALDILVLGAGYGVSIYAGARGLMQKRIAGWWLILFSMPLYWLLMSVAGWMAVFQFIFNPFYWNKTRHGLSRFTKPTI